MAKQDNTIWWVIGVIVVLVVLVGGGIGIFNTERSQCLRDGGEWVDDAFTGGNFCLKQTLQSFKDNCIANRGRFRTIDINDPDYKTDQLGGQDFCDCSLEGQPEVTYHPSRIFRGCGFTF